MRDLTLEEQIKRHVRERLQRGSVTVHLSFQSAQALTMDTTASTPPRLTSLDALRGFDMMWILGGDSLAYALNKTGSVGITKLIGDQLEHVEWAGFHFYDLIFPMFVFIVGVSLVFSLDRIIEQHGRAEALKRVFKRSILLFVVALFLLRRLQHALAGHPFARRAESHRALLFLRQFDLLLRTVARDDGDLRRAADRLLGADELCAVP